MLYWIGVVFSSVIFGIVTTLFVQLYFLHKYFTDEKLPTATIPKLSNPPFKLPQVLLDKLHCDGGTTPSDGCAPLNILFQFLFHELRDTERTRKWFRNKLTIEFEELLKKSAIGRMFSSIKVRDISLGSEFPIINSIVIDDVKINEQFNHIDSVDLKLEFCYKGGFRLIVDANMMLGKTAFLSIKVGSIQGQARLQFTRIPYSHWSFSFYEDPSLDLHVESQFQGRPMPQITTLISSQIRKAIKKKHTLPNFKLRYKPFFTVGEDSLHVDEVPCCTLNIHIHRLSRLPHTWAFVYCLVGVDPLPWIDIITYAENTYYLVDVTVTKRHGRPLGITCKPEFRSDKNKACVVVDQSSQSELLAGDVIISVDGRKVTTVGQVPKLMRAAAVQVTVRVERRAPGLMLDTSLRDQSASEGDSSGSSSMSNSPARLLQRADSAEHKKSRRSVQGKHLLESATSPNPNPRTVATKTVKNHQIAVLEEDLTLNIQASDRFFNITVRGVSGPADKQETLIAYLNIPLSKLFQSPDSLHCCQFKPPDSFAASNSRAHELSSHNGFIPLLSFGDIVLTAEAQGVTLITGRTTPSSVDRADPTLGQPQGQAVSRHKFVRTHLQSSTQCQFCGKKIWFKDAEKCHLCEMTCHKKCVAKCTTGTVCSGTKLSSTEPASPTRVSELEIPNDVPKGGFMGSRRKSTNPEIITTEVTPPTPTNKSPTPNVQSGTRKGLSGLLASVASAGRGLKRAGSAHNLQLPDEGGAGDGQSRSLPPSPQQSPTPSRKPSLPLELSEDISTLLASLLENGADLGEMMSIAKAKGKNLYEELGLTERKEKIQEMMSKLQSAINNEAEVRLTMENVKPTSKDSAADTKTAFLIGKSDEKTQALTVLMLHFCAALQHIQDLEEQERENAHGDFTE